MTVPVSTEGWPRTYRIVSSRFPPISVFESVADPADLEAVMYVEGLTNPRIREEMGLIDLVPPAERLAGPGTTPIMAAFTHPNPSGSRFSNGEYGVYYAANSQDTAVAETVFHVERWAQESNDPATSFTMRVYVGELHEGPYHDLRGLEEAHPEWFDTDPALYAPAQQLAGQLRADDSWGLLYNSVRHHGGECIAAFKPTALGQVRQSVHLAYLWDGAKIVDVIELRSLGLPHV